MSHYPPSIFSKKVQLVKVPKGLVYDCIMNGIGIKLFYRIEGGKGKGEGFDFTYVFQCVDENLDFDSTEELLNLKEDPRVWCPLYSGHEDRKSVV